MIYNSENPMMTYQLRLEKALADLNDLLEKGANCAEAIGIASKENFVESSDLRRIVHDRSLNNT